MGRPMGQNRATHVARPSNTKYDIGSLLTEAGADIEVQYRYVKLRGECVNPTIGSGYAFFDLVDSRDDIELPTIRVALTGSDFFRADRHHRGADQSGRGLERVLRAGHVLRVEGSLGLDQRNQLILECRLIRDQWTTNGKVAADFAYGLNLLQKHARVLERNAGKGSHSHRGSYEELGTCRRVTVASGENAQATQDFANQVNAGTIHVRYVSTGVQGQAARDNIVSLLKRAKPSETDAIFLVRGGGSWKDLQTFNSHKLMMAIADCRVHVYTALGHYGTVTLADHAATATFITPTEAGRKLAQAAWKYQRRSVQRPDSSSIVDRPREYRFNRLVNERDTISKELAILKNQHRDLQNEHRDLRKRTTSRQKQVMDSIHAAGIGRIQYRARIWAACLTAAACLGAAATLSMLIGQQWTTAAVLGSSAVTGILAAHFTSRGSRRAVSLPKKFKEVPTSMDLWLSEANTVASPRRFRQLWHQVPRSLW